MKLLYTNVYYPKFFNSFYKKFPGVTKFNYRKHQQLIYDQLMLASDYIPVAFQELGVNVESILLNAKPLQDRWAFEHKLNTHHFLDWTLGRIPLVRGTFRPRWVYKAFISQVEDFKPDVIYMHNINYVEPEILYSLKNRVKLIVGQIASPLPENQFLTPYDMIFSSLPNLVREIQFRGIRSALVPLAFEPRIIPIIGRQKRQYNLTFVGGFSPLHQQRIKLINKVGEELPIDIFGYGSHLVNDIGSMIRHHGETWGKQMYEILAQSRITINNHIDMAINYANNLRLFEATGMKTLLITDYKSNLNELFVPGKEVETYRSPEELITKVKYYLDNPNKADKIIKAGYRRVIKDHTYIERCKMMLTIIKML